jgi:hypothetical protein
LHSRERILRPCVSPCAPRSEPARYGDQFGQSWRPPPPLALRYLTLDLRRRANQPSVSAAVPRAVGGPAGTTRGRSCRGTRVRFLSRRCTIEGPTRFATYHNRARIDRRTLRGSSRGRQLGVVTSATRPSPTSTPGRAYTNRLCPCVESKRVDEFENMSDEELRQYVYGNKEGVSFG